MKSLFLSSLLALGLLAVPAQAAEYPAKPITLMTAFNAGGGSDVSHRLLEKFAKGVFDQPIVVTYKAGAGGEIGWTWLVGAKADGYTIGGVDLPHIVLQPMLRPEGQPGYKTEQLSPLCGLVYDADVVMVPEDGPYKTFKDLIEYAKANPGKVKVATVGKLTGDSCAWKRPAGSPSAARNAMSCAPTCPRLLNRATPLNPANIAGSPRPRTFLPKHGSIWKPSSRNSAPTLNTRRRSRAAA